MTHITIDRAVAQQMLGMLLKVEAELKTYYTTETEEVRALYASITALRAALAQQAEPPGSMPQHERLKQMEAQAQAEPTVPSDYADSHQPKACQEEPPICRLCYGIGYDASGQLCACQDNPSLD